jgi:hypothetical protein
MHKVSPPIIVNAIHWITGITYFLFIWLFIKTDLLYYSIMPNGIPFPVFQTGTEFFLACLHQPTGLLDYLTALISQSYAVAWLGALTTTMQSAVAYTAIMFIGRRINAPWLELIACVPGIVSLIMLGSYTNPVQFLTLVDIVLVAVLIALIAATVMAIWKRHGVGLTPIKKTSTGIMMLFAALALCATIASMAIPIFNHGERDKARLTAFICLGRWDDIIKVVNSYPLRSMDAATVFDLNMALFHTARMGSEMFTYPQPISTVMDGVMPGKSLQFSADIRFARFHYDIGDINRAQKALYETFVNETEHPYVLNFIAECHLVKGQTAAAAMIYRRLCRDLVYSRRAKAMLRMLDDDTAYVLPDNIREKRELVLQNDTTAFPFSIKQLYIDLLERDPGNRMALEYLLATCLFSGELQLFVDYLEHYGALYAGTLPRHWAEAVAMFNSMSPPDKRRFTGLIPEDVISESIAFQNAFMSIRKTCMQDGLDQAAFNRRAYESLRERFGNTVLFLYFFHESGAVRWYH